MIVRKSALLLLLMLSLMACASVPLGTMLRLARFDLEDLQKVDPAEIRAAIKTHVDFHPGEASLSLKIDLADGSETLIDEKYVLQQMPDWAARAHQLKPAPSDRHWLVFRLQDDDLDRFRVMQRQLAELENDERERSGALSVGTRDSEFPPGVETIPFSVDFQLAAADGFFTLIKEYQLPIDTAAAGAPGD